MEVLVVLILASCFYNSAAHDSDEFEHQLHLPDECHENDFFVLLLSEGGCQPCRCKDDEWEYLEKLYHPDHCCKKFGSSCSATQCEFGDSSIVLENDMVVTCDCSDEGYWSCSKWYTATQSCEHFGKLCECELGDTMAVPDGEGCHRCSCLNGFWDCKKGVIYGKEECCENWNVQCPGCCANGKVNINLKHKQPSVVHTMDGVEVIEEAKSDCTGDACQCASSALVKVEFDKLEPHCGCAKEPMCQKRQLQVDVRISRNHRQGIFLNIGDSQFNFGQGGDQTTATKYDAEIVAKDNNIYVYQNEYCNHAELPYLDALPYGSEHVRFYIGNEFVRMQTQGESVESRCDNCLFGLDKQAEDRFIFIGLNRAVDGSSTGSGICHAWLHWVCPSVKRDWISFMKSQDYQL